MYIPKLHLKFTRISRNSLPHRTHVIYDSVFIQYLDKIGDAFFGPPNQSHPAGGSAVPGPSGILGLGGAGSFIGELTLLIRIP